MAWRKFKNSSLKLVNTGDKVLIAVISSAHTLCVTMKCVRHWHRNRKQSLRKKVSHQEQTSKFKSKLNGRARQQMRWGTVWPWSKPRPATRKKVFFVISLLRLCLSFSVSNGKELDLTIINQITLSLSGNLSFLGGPLLLPSHTSCSSPSEVKMLQKKS